MNIPIKKMVQRKLFALRCYICAYLKPNKRRIKHINYLGLEFLVIASEDVGWRLICDGSYEALELSWAESFIQPGDTCIDVGGNIGVYSIVFGRRTGNTGEVYVFEPVPLNIKILEANCALNGIDNIHVIDAVVSDKDGTLSFSISEDAAYSSIRPTGRKEVSGSIIKKSITLDSYFIGKSDHIGIVKIDTEGAELLVLKGAKNILTGIHRPRALLVELDEVNQKPFGYKPSDVIHYMNTCGYSVFSITDKGIEDGWPLSRCSEDALFLPIGS